MIDWVNYWQDQTGLWPFLVQYRSPITGLFQPPGYPGYPSAPQVDIDPCNERRGDWYLGLPFGQEHCDCVLSTTGPGAGNYAIQYESFAPWGPYRPRSGDGGNLVGVTKDGFIRAFATSDGGHPSGLYYFVGPPGANGWIMGGTDAALGGGWVAHLCMLQQSYPGPNNPEGGLSPAWTRYRRDFLEVPVAFNGATVEVNNYECIVSEHYGNTTPDTSDEFERFVLAKGWGLIRWEFWSKTAPPIADLEGRTPAMQWCAGTYGGATAGFHLSDIRHYMNLLPAPSNFRIADVGWPGSIMLP